ncbi:MAG: ABC transporter substrate-binding protein [Hymenobacteraceae bacterium]|nr:ABC transporter substrate-binding protein [Hymenobacteraceae bacterium]
MRDIHDHLHRPVRVPAAPQRIVSLVPSQTELLFDLGVGARVVGVTKFCLHPKNARTAATVIGGTKQFDFEKIAALQPDLIIGNKEENYAEGISQLAADFPVWLSDIVTLPDAQRMIRDVGALVNADAEADKLNTEIATGFATLAAAATGPRTLYLIWRNPWMGAGAGTFIHEMLQAGGFPNVLAHHARYPALTAEEITHLQPAVVFLSSEPYPFRARHLAELRALCPDARIELVDGELFSWYGSRLRHTPDYLRLLRTRLA